MSVETLDQAAKDVKEAAKDVKLAAAAAGEAAVLAGEAGHKAFNEALAAAEVKITEAAKVAEKAIREGVEALRAQTKAYSQNAGEQVDEAQRYVLETVRARPLTSALAGLGLGVLLGLLLSNRGK